MNHSIKLKCWESPESIPREWIVGIVCHDAGSASLVNSWLPMLPPTQRVEALGPAKSLMTALAAHSSAGFERWVRSVDLLIVGTGWQSSRPIQAMQAAREVGVPVLAVLDNWVNFRERFQLDGLHLPNGAVVSDQHALMMARMALPELPIQQWPNQYLIDLRTHLGSIHRQGSLPVPSGSDQRRLLVLTEPLLRNTSSLAGEPEESPLNQLREYLSNDRSARERTLIRLRLHPAESASKYDSFVDRVQAQGIHLELSSEGLAHDFAWATVVVGWSSYALYLSASLGIATWSWRPPTDVTWTVFPPHSGVTPLTEEDIEPLFR